MGLAVARNNANISKINTVTNQCSVWHLFLCTFLWKKFQKSVQLRTNTVCGICFCVLFFGQNFRNQYSYEPIQCVAFVSVYFSLGKNFRNQYSYEPVRSSAIQDVFINRWCPHSCFVARHIKHSINVRLVSDTSTCRHSDNDVVWAAYVVTRDVLTLTDDSMAEFVMKKCCDQGCADFYIKIQYHLIVSLRETASLPSFWQHHKYISIKRETTYIRSKFTYSLISKNINIKLRTVTCCFP